MMMRHVFLLAIFLVILRFSAADRKRCFCKAVAADNHDNVLHDFGTIAEHHNWLTVGCRRLHGCSSKCDQKVKEWVCAHQAECKAKAKGKHVVPYYTASVCGKGAGNNSRPCECNDGGFDKVRRCQLQCIGNLFSQGHTAFLNCLNTCIA
ncbi:uncharacterized protein LOC132742643 isoform X2 [Ruditapes philippinarum]|uniref:uncharacterized protein LOC132742643 isoform X2 n=1 Tax=Ruditapes philippinarum TaxID=129788 RepID=UPI00295AA05E|nr:uncharacterized protein LOC132742643 isoform X2 [Ruditapes philippinarum]